VVLLGFGHGTVALVVSKVVSKVGCDFGRSLSSMSMRQASLRATSSLIRPERDASDSSRFCTALSRLADTRI
jgi:hypothetical protein